MSICLEIIHTPMAVGFVILKIILLQIAKGYQVSFDLPVVRIMMNDMYLLFVLFSTSI